MVRSHLLCLVLIAAAEAACVWDFPVSCLPTCPLLGPNYAGVSIWKGLGLSIYSQADPMPNPKWDSCVRGDNAAPRSVSEYSKSRCRKHKQLWLCSNKTTICNTKNDYSDTLLAVARGQCRKTRCGSREGDARARATSIFGARRSRVPGFLHPLQEAQSATSRNSRAASGFCRPVRGRDA